MLLWMLTVAQHVGSHDIQHWVFHVSFGRYLYRRSGLWQIQPGLDALNICEAQFRV